MTTTPRLGAPELTSGQATPETTVNEQIRYVEQGASYFIAKDKDLTAPPGSPADGDCYIVAASPTGAWSGKAKKLAFYESTAWAFITPVEGTRCYLQDENLAYEYDGAAWGTVAAGYTDENARDAIGTALTGGTGITVTPNDGADTITVAVDTSAEAERIRDAIGSALVAGTNITLTVNDPGDTITIDAASAGSITSKDEGSNLTTATTSFNFVGAGVVATNVGGAVTVTISGGGGGGTLTIGQALPLALGLTIP